MFSFFGKIPLVKIKENDYCLWPWESRQKYAKTRHNAGFMVIDFLCNKFDLKLKKKWRSEYAELEYEG